MNHRWTRTMFTLAPLFLLFAVRAFSQSAPLSRPETAPIHNWQTAWSRVPAKAKIQVVTVDQPHRTRGCHIQSFTPEKLVCSGPLGHSHTYLPQNVIALILPGDGEMRFPLWLGFNAGLGAAIWATVVLTATCPACAVATGIAALLFFGAAGSTLYADETPDRLLYLAPGQTLTGNLGLIHP